MACFQQVWIVLVLLTCVARMTTIAAFMAAISFNLSADHHYPDYRHVIRPVQNSFCVQIPHPRSIPAASRLLN